MTDAIATGDVDRRGGVAWLSQSKAGLLFVALSIVTAWGAAHSGANLTYLVFGSMLGALLLSGAAAAWNLSGLRVRREMPKHLYAGRRFTVRLIVENRGRGLSGFSLKVHDGAPRDLDTLESRCYAVRVPARRGKELEYTGVFRRRGLHRFGAITARSRFPFGFFANRRSWRADEEVLVYPAIGRLKGELPYAGSGYEYAEGLQMSRREGTEDFYGLREYRPGDNPRRIHWKRSARLQKPLVMEFIKPPERDVDIYVDNYVSKGWEERLEETISCAATVLEALQREGCRTGVKVAGSRIMQCGGDWKEYHLVMKRLALLRSSETGLKAEEVEGGVSRQAILLLAEPSRKRSPMASAVTSKYPQALVLAAGTEGFNRFFSMEEANGLREGV